jgi:ribose-phosphate pyrophosphokinase
VNIVGDIVGKDVLIVDDITETAGTLVNAAKLLRANGAKSVRAAVSHALLSPMAYERLGAGDIDELITTNSIPVEPRGLPITVLSVAELLGQAAALPDAPPDHLSLDGFVERLDGGVIIEIALAAH